MLQPNDTILFQGDSITDAGRNGTPDRLGGGYVAMIAGMLRACMPNARIKIVNRGCGGDRTVELLKRWSDDCLTLKPDVLSIKIGVNDVWRLRGEWNGQAFVPMAEFRANYRQLIEQAAAAGIRRLVLVSPTTIANETDAELVGHLNERAGYVRELASEFNAVYVPAREAFVAALREQPEIRWTGDGCHPTPAGHALLAATWVQSVVG